MDIRDIEYFMALAKQGSFTRTAAGFYITQSALSQKISALESELGVKLFARTGRGVKLTQAGEVLYDHALGIMRGWENMRQAMAHFRSDTLQNISVGLFSQAAYTEFPAMITDFISLNPGCCVNISMTSEGNLLEGVRSGRFNFALLRCNRALLPAGISSQALFAENVCILFHREDKLAAKENITLEDIVDYRLICEKEEFDNSYGSLKNNFRDAGLTLHAPYAYTDQASMLPMLISGPGCYTFTTTESARRIPERFPDLCARPLYPPVTVTANLLYSADCPEAADHPFFKHIRRLCRSRTKQPDQN